MRNSLWAGLLGFGFALLLAFTSFTSPPRHPGYSATSIATGAAGFIVQIPSGGSAAPVFAATVWEAPLLSISTGLGAGALLATGTVYGGFTTKSALTLTTSSLYVSVASSNTAANQVLTATDGTNTCTFTFPCNSNAPNGTLSAGVALQGGSNGAGTGCVYAANANITFSTTTQGCGTAATVKNIIVYGIPTGL